MNGHTLTHERCGRILRAIDHKRNLRFLAGAFDTTYDNGESQIGLPLDIVTVKPRREQRSCA